MERQLQQLIDVKVSYSLSGQLEYSLREANYTIDDITYAEDITYHCAIPLEKVDTFRTDIANWTSAQAEVTENSKAWIEVPVSE